jgi:uncharacterized membrane protein (UPF0127 family)
MLELGINGVGSGVFPRRADGFWARLVGLLNRSQLAADEGLWISPCERVHTFGMRMAIDVLMLDSAGKVVALHAELGPWRLGPSGCSGGTALELAPGSIARLKLCIGDELTRGEPSSKS